MASDETGLTARQREIRDRFEAERGFWTDLLDSILELDPEFLDRFRAISGHPWTDGVLDPEVRELIYVANDCSTNHMYRDGTRVHVGNALEYGASVEEIVEVFQLASLQGFNTLRVGIPIVLEELGAGTTGAAAGGSDSRPKYHAGFWHGLSELDAAFAEKCVKYEAHPWDEGPLEPRVKALVLIAVNVATTTLYPEAVRTYVRVAADYGASVEEIVEVIQLSSVVGFHSVTDSLPILLEEARKRDRL